MKTVLLTGATGFVGRQILRALLAEKVNIVPVVRSGKESSLIGLPSFHRVVNSPDIFMESVDWWAKQCESVDIVIHSAWYTEPGKYLRSSLNMDCLMGSLRLAQGAVNAGVSRLIGIGTCFEYDLSARVLTADTPLRPLSAYAGAKVALYHALVHWLPEQSVEFAWCRLFYLFGEGEDERRFIPYIHKQLASSAIVELTKGAQIRDFINVSEAGRLIAQVAVGDKKGPINICSGVPVTIRQVAESIASEYGQRDLLRFGAREDNFVDPPCVLGIPNHGVPERCL